MLKNGIDFPWHDIEDFGTHIGFLASARIILFPGSLETPRQGSSDLCVGGKNGMRSMRPCSLFLLRQEGSKYSGSLLWGHADLPGGGDPTGLLPKVQESEAGKNKMACRQPFLYKAIRFLCRTPMSRFVYYRCCQGVAPELENCEVSGKRIHAGAVETSGVAGAEGNRC